MSSKNKRGGNKRRGEHGESASSPATPPAEGVAATEPRRRLTIPERLVAKSNNIHALVKDVLDMLSFYGSSPDVVSSTQSLLVEADSWRGKIQELVAGGWQPTLKADLKELAEGDKIAVTAESKSLYEYIPAGVLLAVGKIERSANNRIKRVMLCDERVFGEGVSEGSPTAFGWAQLSHIERR